MLLSVITICYNQEAFIAQTIESVLNQKTDFEFEYIIGDDCSNDSTSQIIGKYAAKDDTKIIFIQNSTNLGLIDNYTNCLEKAKGKYIATLDGDDYWSDVYKLKKQIDFLEANPKYGMVHTQYEEIYMYPRYFGRRNIKYALGKNTKDIHYTFEGLLSGSYICSSSACFRKSIIESSDIIDKFKDGFFEVEDVPVWLQISLTHKIGYLNNSTTVYRINRNSLSHFTNREQRLIFINNLFKLYNYFSTKRKVSSFVLDNILRNKNLSLAFHYFKSNEFENFKLIFNKIYKPPFSIRAMYLILLMKKKGLIKIDDLFKF